MRGAGYTISRNTLVPPDRGIDSANSKYTAKPQNMKTDASVQLAKKSAGD